MKCFTHLLVPFARVSTQDCARMVHCHCMHCRHLLRELCASQAWSGDRNFFLYSQQHFMLLSFDCQCCVTVLGPHVMSQSLTKRNYRIWVSLFSFFLRRFLLEPEATISSLLTTVTQVIQGIGTRGWRRERGRPLAEKALPRPLMVCCTATNMWWHLNGRTTAAAPR